MVYFFSTVFLQSPERKGPLKTRITSGYQEAIILMKKLKIPLNILIHFDQYKL